MWALIFWEITFCSTNGTVFWLYVPEITVDKGLSIAIFVRMMTLFILVLITMPLITLLGDIQNWFFFWAFFQLFVFAVDWKILKETRGLSGPDKKALYRPKNRNFLIKEHLP